MSFVDPVWHDFTRRHLRPEVVADLADLFGSHWRPPLPDGSDIRSQKPGWVGAGVAPTESGFPRTQDEADVFLDCRLETIGASPDAAGSHRRQHLDLPARYFSALFYMREPEDDTEGGGLQLFRWTGGRPENAFQAFELNEKLVEIAAVIPYAANRLVVFPNSPDALHGAEIRGPGRFQRHYVFITAEGTSDLW